LVRIPFPFFSDSGFWPV